MKIDYNLLKIFAKVAEHGSFTAAAKVLSQPKSRVSRAISRLENELDVQLLKRTTRKTSLTNDGSEFYKNIHPLISGIDNELIKVSDRQQEMSGEIRLTASQDIGQTLVAQLISAYNDRYPNVQFVTTITNEYLDLTKEDIDLAFRAGRLDDSSLIQKKIMSSKFIMVCSRAYLEKFGCPNELQELSKHKFLSFRGIEKNFPARGQSVKPILTTDSIPMLLNMALNGGGITSLPDFFCREHLEAKKLVRIIPSWQSKTGNIHILYPPTKKLPKKVRLFIELAAEVSQDTAYLG